MSGQVAVIAGASGIVGRHLSAYLVERGDWSVIELSRRPADHRTDTRHLAVDLTDQAALVAALAPHSDISHVFYAGRAPCVDPAEEAELNGRMLRNLVEATEAASPALAHVCLVHGTKWYGSHLGPYKTPAREDDPRHLPPNFYYDQQDYVTARQSDATWTWSALRPHLVTGFSVRYPHNMVAGIALYGSLCKALGLPLRYPGTPAGFSSISQITDAETLAKAIVWVATNPACHGQAFNIVNDDYYRWCDLWPVLADFFGMKTAPPQQVSLETMMADKEPLWRAIVREHGLERYALADLVSWPYADYTLAIDWDDMSATTAIRRLGFAEYPTSEETFLRVLSQYRAQRIIP